MDKNRIPKKIHYCWFGGKEKPELMKKCIESWKKYCPDYEIIEWNETNFDTNINNYVKEAYEHKRYAFVADFARLWVVNKYGGIYLDTDVELIKNIDDVLQYKAFFASEDNICINTGLGFGSEKKNKILKGLIEDYNISHFIQENGNQDKTTCPVRNTKIIKKYIVSDGDFSKRFIENDICYFSKEYFCPLDYETKKLSITNNTYAIHWFNGSWITTSDKIKIKIGKILKKLLNR